MAYITRFLTWLEHSKRFKDFVADFLMGLTAGIPAVTVFGSWSDTYSAALIVSFAAFKALIQAAFRTVLKWATT